MKNVYDKLVAPPKERGLKYNLILFRAKNETISQFLSGDGFSLYHYIVWSRSLSAAAYMFIRPNVKSP